MHIRDFSKNKNFFEKYFTPKKSAYRNRKGDFAMSNYAIMRWGKIKFGGIAGAEYHQRTELHKNCEHPEMRDSNFTVKQFENETLRQTVKRFMIQQQEQTGRRLRKDATVLVDFVLTFSPEMTGKIDMQKWIDANLDWLKKEFGSKNLLRFDMHWHESTPHLHAFILPLDDKDKFNFKHYVRHVSQLVGLQDRYAKAMEPFGLERGQTRWQTFEEGKPQKAFEEKVRHTPLRAWRQQMLDELKEMEQKLQVNQELDEDIGDKLEQLQQLRIEIESRKGKSKKFAKRLDELRKECDKLQGQKASLQSELKDLEKDMQTEKDKFSALQQQAEALSKNIEHRRNNLAQEIWGYDVNLGYGHKVADKLDEISEEILGGDDDPEH